MFDYVKSAAVAAVAFALLFVAVAILPDTTFDRRGPQNLDDTRAGSSIDIRSVGERDRRLEARAPAGESLRIAAPTAADHSVRRLQPPIPAERYDRAYRPGPDETLGRQADPPEGPLAYRTILPRSAYSGRPTAVLVILPDRAESGVELLESWRQTAAQSGLVLAAPARGWEGRAADEVVATIIDDLAQEVTVDRGRIYLFANGRSGAVALEAAKGGAVRALALHGRAGAASIAGQRFLPASGERPMPVALFMGSAKGPIPYGVAKEAASRLATAGYDVTLAEIAGHTDWYQPIGDWMAGEIWAFFRRT